MKEDFICMTRSLCGVAPFLVVFFSGQKVCAYCILINNCIFYIARGLNYIKIAKVTMYFLAQQDSVIINTGQQN